MIRLTIPRGARLTHVLAIASAMRSNATAKTLLALLAIARRGAR